MDKNNDTISRQAAIDTLFELYEYQREIDPTEEADLVRQGVLLAEKRIEKLPSAQPEIVRCTECEYYDATTEHCTNDKGLRFIDYSNPDGMWCAWAERREE